MSAAKAWCNTCKFFESIDEKTGLGRCKRNNPVPYVAAVVNPKNGYKIEAAAAWPVVRTDDWCGEHMADTDRIEDVQGVYDGRV